MSSPTPPSPARRLRFIHSAEAALAPAPDALHVVLDTSWTPLASDRPDVRPLRPAFSSVVKAHDLFAESLDLVDRWGADADAAGIVQVAGVTYWFRLREELWHWTHERLLWRHALAAIDPAGAYGTVSIPDNETALIDVVRALGRTLEIEATPAIEPGVAAAGEPAAGRLPHAMARFLPAGLRRALRRRVGRGKGRGAARARPADALEQRLARLASEGGERVLVLTLPSSYQRVGSDSAAARRDPNLGTVIPALAEAGLQPIVIGWGMRGDRAEDVAAMEVDQRLLPAGFIQSRWGRPEDADRAASAVEGVAARWRELEAVPFRIDGLDLSAAFAGFLRDLIARTFTSDLPMLARLERLIEDLKPRAILMTQEGRRLPVLIAASRAGVPTFALQHGVLYPAHPGYPDRRHPSHVLPSCTFVFGEYEREVLEAGAYRPGEVVVSGSPRLDVEDAPAPQERERDRTAVRAQLGVAVGDRLLVVSTLHQPFVRRSHLVHMLEATLGGPLPGVHVVFKLHPGERDDGPYRALLTGLARAGGYAPPPMTIVKDIDLYRLLRAADAHLGQHSTVLTDAVIAGTPNLISLAEASADLLGYVAAGVARPVRDVGEVLAALHDPERPSAGVRAAFLRAHFHEGRASTRIAGTIRSAVRGPAQAGIAV
jgi:hypothetical protein